MAEKRYFKENFCDEYAIKKEDIIIAVVDSGSNARRICDELNALYDENKQLKKENMEYYHLVNCGNCKYHNYDWFDDGDEFEVCDKGHTERLMYNKFCKEWREF